MTPADLDDINSSISEINEQLGNLGDDVDGLGDQLSDLDGQLTDLNDDVQGRLDSLENPDILSCSVEELCIPDGVDLTTQGIADIIELVCEHEVECCTDAELNLKFGPGITTAQQCEDLFADVVNNGLSPAFLQDSPYIVNQIIGIAQALNDPNVHVELNADGIADCVDSLRERECPEYTEVEPSEPECTPIEYGEEDVCALGNLLTGMQKEGELCGEYGGGYNAYYAIPECEPGLYCSWSGSIEGYRGICSKLPEEGDGCQRDLDCDPLIDEGYSPNGTMLYCNIENAQCEPLGDVGDPCEYINDDFSIYDSNLVPTNSSRSATSQDCMPGLSCDPSSNTCVARCSEGFLCSAEGDPFFSCGEGRVCNVTEFPKLLENFGLGICSDPLEEGDDCTLNFHECGSGACTEDCDFDTSICSCGADFLQPGDDCDAPGLDPLCVTGMCGQDSTCVSYCDCDPNADWDCDYINDAYGWDPTYCGTGSYCDESSEIENPDHSGYFGYGCEVKIDNGTACDTTTYDRHVSCKSGFCDPDPGDDDVGPFDVCSPKQTDTTDGACTSGLDEECPNNQYCNNNNICKPYVALNGPCDLADPSGLRCADGLVCVDDTTDTCQAYAKSGEACSNSATGEPQCDSDLDLYCIDIDGSGVGTVTKCYDYDGGFADGVECQNQDSYCASGWCLPNGPVTPSAYACAQPLEEGDDCDTADITLDKCAPGLFCNHPNGETAGKCSKQHRPGQSCKPYFAGQDCINGYNGSCIFTKDQFLCNQYSQPEETIFCDGN